MYYECVAGSIQESNRSSDKDDGGVTRTGAFTQSASRRDRSKGGKLTREPGFLAQSGRQLTQLPLPLGPWPRRLTTQIEKKR